MGYKWQNTKEVQQITKSKVHNPDGLNRMIADGNLWRKPERLQRDIKNPLLNWESVKKY
jgi:hypothetical protein